MAKTITKIETQPKASGKYFQGTGRRKTAVARVRLFKTHTAPSVNGQSLEKVFPMKRLQSKVLAPLTDLKLEMGLVANVSGGGMNAQA